MDKKIAIITGADGGMGSVMTQTLLESGCEVVMACKNPDKARVVCTNLGLADNHSLKIIPLDLSSFVSITAFVEKVKETVPHVNILLNNAGVLCHKPAITKEGVEMTVGVNYLGHYLLTRQLLPLLSENARIVNMVSLTFKYGQITESFFQPLQEKQFNRFSAYSNSKLALLYFTLDLAEELKGKGVTVNCADPGIVSTPIIRMGNSVIDKLCDIFYRPLIKTPAQGAAGMLYLALSPEVETITGGCFTNKKQRQLPEKIRQHPQRELLKKMTSDLIYSKTGIKI